MTGLSSQTLEIVLLVLSVGMLVLSYLYRRTRKDAYNIAFMLTAYIKTQVMISRDRAAAKEKVSVPLDK